MSLAQYYGPEYYRHENQYLDPSPPREWGQEPISFQQTTWNDALCEADYGFMGRYKTRVALEKERRAKDPKRPLIKRLQIDPNFIRDDSQLRKRELAAAKLKEENILKSQREKERADRAKEQDRSAIQTKESVQDRLIRIHPLYPLHGVDIQKCLDMGRRYHEIYSMNLKKGCPQSYYDCNKIVMNEILRDLEALCKNRTKGFWELLNAARVTIGNPSP